MHDRYWEEQAVLEAWEKWTGVPAQPSVIDPPHYQAGGFDLIDVIGAFELNYNLGCTAKYIFRAGRKPDAPKLVDLQKAARYLAQEISRVSAQQPADRV